MSCKLDVLIVGAGPVGLVHAIECARLGLSVRIIDAKAKATRTSNAVGINPRTLELLDAANVTPLLIEKGIKIKKMQFWDHHYHRLAHFNLNLITHHYNFLLSLPQNETEKLFIKVLAKLGIKVERNTTLKSFTETKGVVKAICQTKTGQKTIQARYLIGADGIHSIVRQTLKLPFKGFRYDDDWSLVDVMLTCPKNLPDANLFMLGKRGMLFLVRIGEGHYRAISNHPDVTALFPKNIKINKILWASHFHVSCRQVTQYQKGNVFIMGDAAHIHSPAGGRGMNLGIEDACVLARMIKKGNTSDYTANRYPVGKETIEFTNRLFKMASGTNPLMMLLRNLMIKYVLSRTVVQRKMLVQLAGLGHHWQT